MTAGTFGATERRSRPAFRWSAAPIIDGEIVGRSGADTRVTVRSWGAARRTITAALVLAALLCTLALLAFPGT